MPPSPKTCKNCGEDIVHCKTCVDIHGKHSEWAHKHPTRPNPHECPTTYAESEEVMDMDRCRICEPGCSCKKNGLAHINCPMGYAYVDIMDRKVIDMDSKKPKTIDDLKLQQERMFWKRGVILLNDVQDLLRERIKEMDFIMDEEFKGDDIIPSDEWVKASIIRDELVRLLGQERK